MSDDRCASCGTNVPRHIDCPTCGRPGFDAAEAAAMLVGKTVLIGRRYQQDDEPEPHAYEQMHGVVESVTDPKGISVRLEGARGGEYQWLPPDLRSFHVAAPGDYSDKATGETISNPDFIVTFRVSQR